MTRKEDRIWLFVGIVWSLAIWALYAAGIRYLLRNPMVFVGLGLLFLLCLFGYSIKISKQAEHERKAHFSPLYKIGDTTMDLVDASIPIVKSILEQIGAAAIGVVSFLIGLAGYRIRD